MRRGGKEPELQVSAQEKPIVCERMHGERACAALDKAASDRQHCSGISKKRGSTLRTRPSRGHGQPGATAASWQSRVVGLPLVPLPLQPSLPSSPGECTHSPGTWVVAHSPGAVTVPCRPPSLCIDGFFSRTRSYRLLRQGCCRAWLLFFLFLLSVLVNAALQLFAQL